MDKLTQDDIIIAFIGPTGAGKSHFIDLLSNEEGKRSGHSLKSETAKIQVTRIRNPTTGIDNIVLVDTPGFDDTFRSDLEIIVMLSNWLKKTYKNGIKLRGLVYLQAINESRMSSTANKNLRMFYELCGGSGAAHSVILVLTKWQEMKSQERAQSREKEFKEDFWLPFAEAGSRIERMTEDNSAKAWRIVDDLIQGTRDGIISLSPEKAVGLELRHRRKELTSQRDFLPSLPTRTEVPSDGDEARGIVEDLVQACKGISAHLQEIADFEYTQKTTGAWKALSVRMQRPFVCFKDTVRSLLARSKKTGGSNAKRELKEWHRKR